MKLHEMQEHWFNKYVADNELSTGGIPITSNDFFEAIVNAHGDDVYLSIGAVRKLMSKTFVKRQNSTTGVTEYFINKKLN